MQTVPNPSTRPTRLPTWFLFVLVGLCMASFLSGVLLWRAQSVAATAEDPFAAASPVKLWLSLHGALNPLLCIVYGWVLSRHVATGWRMRVNRVSGSVVTVSFGLLILTGTALYYVGNEAGRIGLVWCHRGVGLALPLFLSLHWLGAIRWTRGLDKK